MRHETFDVETELQELTGPVRATLADIAAGLDARFLSAGETLASAVETIDRVLQSLDEVGRAFDEGDAGAAVGNLTQVAQSLNEVPEQQAARGRKLETIRTISSRLGSCVAEASSTLDALKIYAINVKIASSGEQDFVDFAERMQSQLVTGEEQIKGFKGKLVELAASLEGMEESDSRLRTECARVVPEVPERLVKEAAELHARQEQLVALSLEVRGIARAIQSNVAGVLGAIQIGDITRQRLEHVVLGCTLLDDYLAQANDELVAETRQRMLSLLAAQLDDIAGDFAREAAVLVRSLRGIGPDARRLLDFGQGNDSLTDSRQSLRRLEAGITEAASVTRQLSAADAQAENIARIVGETVEELLLRAKNVRVLRLDVQLMAINIGLRCRRVEQVGRPIAVVANEIRACSERLGESTDAIANAADDLSSVSVVMQSQDSDVRLDCGEALDQSLNAIGEGADRTEAAMQAAGGEASEIVSMIAGTSEQIEASLSLRETIQSLADALAAFAGPEMDMSSDATHPLIDLMAQLRKSYTMAQEREIHDQFRLPGMEDVASEAPQSTGFEDDDDLFEDALF